MVPYLGDFAEDATVYMPFNTFSSDDPSASVTITDLADADIKVHKDGGTTQLTTDGATIAIDYDGITGNHLATIDTSVHADYSTGSDYHVRIEGTTVDGATINAWIGHFSIQNRYSAGALRPTTAGRTLDVTAGGTAGVDWGNVENQSTAVDLSGTDIQLCDTVTTNTDMRGTDSAALASNVPDSLSHANLQTQLVTTYGLDHLVSTSVTGTDVTDNSIVAKLVSKESTADWDDYVNTTDSLQAIRDRGDAAWTTGAGGNPFTLASGTIGATGNDTTHLHLTGLTFGDDELNDCLIVIYDDSASEYHSRWITDWENTGALATVATLPFTPQDSTDTYTVLGIRRDVDASGFAVASVTGNVGGDVQGNVDGSVASVTAGVSLANGAITDASLAGNMEIVFETDFATNYSTTRNAWVTNAQDFVGTTASDPFNAQVVCASVSGSVGSVTGAVGSVTGNVGGDVQGNVDGTVAGVTPPSYDQLEGFVQLICRSDSAIETDRSTLLTAINANEGSGAGNYSAQTDSVEALRDRGDSAWITATTVDLNADQSGVTIGTVTTNSDMRGTDSAATASALATAQTDLDTITGSDGVTLATTQGNYAPAKAGDNMGTVSAVTGGINTASGTITTLDALDTAQDSQHSTTQSNISNLNDPTAAAIATAVFTTAITESYRSANSAPTVAQALCEIIAHLGEFAINSTTKTLKKFDGSTTAKTYTLDDDTSPTSITETS